MAAGDFNDDGWPDLYIGVFRGANRLLLNDAQGGFRDVSTREIDDCVTGGECGQAYGVAVGDIDNDGDLDLFQATHGWVHAIWRPIMFMNLGEGVLIQVLEGVRLGGLRICEQRGGPP